LARTKKSAAGHAHDGNTKLRELTTSRNIVAGQASRGKHQSS